MDVSSATLRLVISAFRSLLSSILKLAPSPVMSASSESEPPGNMVPLSNLVPASLSAVAGAWERDALLPLATAGKKDQYKPKPELKTKQP